MVERQQNKQSQIILTMKQQIDEASGQDFFASSTKVKSEFTQIYNQLTLSIDFNLQSICEMCRRKGVTYDPHSSYQPFQFYVKKMNQNIHYYTIEIIIAHFRLSITAWKSQINLTQNLQSAPKINQNIYFFTINGQQLCLKSYRYSSEESFHELFAIAVRELAILKICSALECTLFVRNFLGFDLLIYDDCIQFAMEKGTEIERLTQGQVSELKRALRLMHELRIIHFDIKPQNIIFSKLYNKAVFIDFGFSQIIEQQRGFKTLTEFRGTPKFCSPQILQIMIAEKAYIDLYYNDVYSLNEVIKNKSSSMAIKQINSDKMPWDLEDIHQYNHSQNKQECNELDFLLLCFQFNYLNLNQAKAKQILNNGLINSQRMVKRLFSFIRTTLNYVFLSSIFYGELSKFQQLQEYVQIKGLLKSNGVRFFSKNIVNNGQLLNEPLYFQPQSFVSGQNECSHLQYNEHVKMILEMQTLEELFFQYFISILYRCLRFIQRNLQLKDKIVIASKAVNLLSKYSGQIKDQYGEAKVGSCLVQIKYLFYLMYQHSLRFEKGWCKTNIINIFQQLILLDVYYCNLLNSLFKYLSQNSTTLQERITMLLQARRLSRVCQLFSTQHDHQMAAIINKFFAFFKEEEQKIKHYSQSIQADSMRNLYLNIVVAKSLNMENLQLSDFFHKEIKSIQSNRFRKNILQYLIYQKIDISFMFQNMLKLLEFANSVRHIINLQNLYFLPYVSIMLRLLDSINDFKNIKSFCDYVINIINCPQISKRFTIITEAQNHIVYLKIDRLNRILLSHGVINEKIQGQLFEVFLIITQQKIHIDNDLKTRLLQLYTNLQKCPQSFLNPQLSSSYYLVYCQSKVQFFFYKLTPQCTSAFLNSLSSCEMELSRINIQQKPQLYICLNFKRLCFKFCLSRSQKKHYEEVQEIQQLFDICKNLKMFFLGFEIFKEAVSTSYMAMKQSEMVHFILRLHELCAQTQYYSLYLLPGNIFLGFMTLATFARKDAKSFYEFLGRLTAFLDAYPIESHLQIFFQILDNFLKKSPENSHLLHFSNFSKQSLRANANNLVFYVLSLKNEALQSQLRLFKTIAVHIDSLSQYAKGYILKKYYCILLDYLSSQKQQRKRFFVMKEAKRYIPYNRCVQQIRILLKPNKNLSKFKISKLTDLMSHLKLFKDRAKEQL